MMDDKLEEAKDQAEDQTFYRDSFGEKITREGEEEEAPMMAETDSDMVSDETVEEEEAAEDMEPAVKTDSDEGFRESLDDAEPTTDEVSTEDSGSDFEDKPATE